MTEFETPAFQPLRITAGWTVAYNNAFYEIDPDPDVIPDEERWWIFKEDMLQLVHENRNRMIDLGFTPEGDFRKGFYRLVILEGDFSGPELGSLSTRDRALTVTTIESWMEKVTAGTL